MTASLVRPAQCVSSIWNAESTCFVWDEVWCGTEEEASLPKISMNKLSAERSVSLISVGDNDAVLEKFTS